MLHALPIRIAISLKIPLVLLGENAAYEYSGSKKFNEKFMSIKWFKYYASNSAMTPKKFSQKNILPIGVYQKPYFLINLC